VLERAAFAGQSEIEAGLRRVMVAKGEPLDRA
jgi:hypothetical protein